MQTVMCAVLDVVPNHLSRAYINARPRGRGVDIPPYMQGKPLFNPDARPGRQGKPARQPAASADAKEAG